MNRSINEFLTTSILYHGLRIGNLGRIYKVEKKKENNLCMIGVSGIAPYFIFNMGEELYRYTVSLHGQSATMLNPP